MSSLIVKKIYTGSKKVLVPFTGNRITTFLEPLLDMGQNIALALQNLEGRFACVKSAEVFLYREILTEECEKRTPAAALETGNKLAVVGSSLARAKLVFYKLGHFYLHQSTIDIV
jgi:hypothetical protein